MLPRRWVSVALVEGMTTSDRYDAGSTWTACSRRRRNRSPWSSELGQLWRQLRAVAKPLEYYSAQYADRDATIAQANRSGAYSMQAIAEQLKVG